MKRTIANVRVAREENDVSQCWKAYKSKPATKGRMKTVALRGALRLGQPGLLATPVRDERTQRELAAFDFGFDC